MLQGRSWGQAYPRLPDPYSADAHIIRVNTQTSSVFGCQIRHKLAACVSFTKSCPVLSGSTAVANEEEGASNCATGFRNYFTQSRDEIDG